MLFLHRISDNRFSHNAQRISAMLKSLCGDSAMEHLMLCTTMWDEVSQKEGYERFDELCKTDAWEEMISMGASTAIISHFSSNAKVEAERIVSELIRNKPTVVLAIQDEIVNQAKETKNTRAGKVLIDGQRKQAQSDRKVKELGRRELWGKIGCVIQ